MRSRNGVEDQIQGSACGSHRVRVTGNNEVISPEFAGGRLFIPVGRDGGDRVAHGLGKLQPHLPETSETKDADIETTLGGTESLQRGEHGDAGAENGSGQLKWVGLGNLRQESTVGRDLVTEATIGVAAVVRTYPAEPDR